VTNIPERKSGRGMMIATVAVACVLGLVGGAVGGAAGAMWVINTMAAPKVSPQAKNAVVEYDGMPKEGARPVDVAGLTAVSTRLNPCLVDFLKAQQAVVGTADWGKVRLHPYFKNDEDIVNQLAFAQGALGITRGNDIYINVPYTPSAIDQLNESLLFHELAHVAQYASGMDLPEYASQAAVSYASGDKVDDIAFEDDARAKAKQLLDLWAVSPQRARCHKDVPEETWLRAPSEQPEISFAIFSSQKGQYELVRHQLHKGRLLVAKPNVVEPAGDEAATDEGQPEG